MIQKAPPLELATVDLLARYDPEGRLKQYFDLLTAENKRVNLVSRETTSDGLVRLAAESLAPLGSITPGSFERYLDIGSGGGFPAVPIMVAAAAGVTDVNQVRLMERTQKRAAALRRMLSALKLRAEIVPEDFPRHDDRSKFALITLRYIKLTSPLLGAIADRLDKGGVFIYYSQPEFTLDSVELSALNQPFKLDRREPTKSFTIFQNT